MMSDLGGHEIRWFDFSLAGLGLLSSQREVRRSVDYGVVVSRWDD